MSYLSIGIHGHGCQDGSVPSPPSESSKLSNIINKSGKREAPDDEQVTFVFSFD